MVGGQGSRATGTLEEEGLVRQVGRHAERVLEERGRMRVGAQRGGPLGSGPQGDAGLGGERRRPPGPRAAFRCAAR